MSGISEGHPNYEFCLEHFPKQMAEILAEQKYINNILET